MAALTVGTKAPEFELKAMDGRRFILSDELAHGPVVLAFFKVSCPTCQYAFPFLCHWNIRLFSFSRSTIGARNNSASSLPVYWVRPGVFRAWGGEHHASRSVRRPQISGGNSLSTRRGKVLGRGG